MNRNTSLFLVLLLLLVPAAALASPPNPMHPVFPLLDEAGQNVQESGEKVSVERTCSGCHDTEFIQEHSSHDLARTGADCATCHVEGGQLTASPDSIDEAGNLKREAILIGAPKVEHCARCHGVASQSDVPLSLPDDFDASMARWGSTLPYSTTLWTGEIIAPQKMSESRMNLAGKDELTAPFDVHAARLVNCTSCHFAPNNPGRVGEGGKELPFLERDPRRLSIAEFIQRPDHELTATNCERCHSPMATHDALPYKDRHLARLACTSCHTPQLHGPSLRTVDATVVTASGGPRVEYRNMDAAAGGNVNARYIESYQPFLFVDPADNRIAPFNLVTEWRWVSGASNDDVPMSTVSSVFLDGAAYAKDILAAFDGNGDGALSYDELRLDTQAKIDTIKKKLEARGVAEPHVAGVVSSHRIHHGVMANERVEHQCDSCHQEQSRLNEDVPLSSYQLAGVTPTLSMLGRVEHDAAGGLLVRRTSEANGFYVLGHDRVPWTDSLGFVLFLATAIGVSVHGGLRYRLRRKHGNHGEVRKEYLYSVYERIWHWLMALSILLLLWTGIEIHWVGAMSLIGFTNAVLLHNVLAVILIGNAFLSLFYHLASNDIRQFIPPRATFFGEVIAQVRYYLNGIFWGAPHPVPKTARRKLNPLQQVTYLMLLNVLIPFQVITGALIWGAQRWPGLSSAVGGLTIITPMHSFGAWMLASFVLTHVYLTTTGHTPLSNIKAMIVGDDEIEVDSPPAHEGGQP